MQTRQLKIEGDMTIYRAVELKQILLDALEQCVALDIDLSMVSELDTTGVQLLLLAQQTADDGKQTLRLLNHSAAVREVFDLLNLGLHFTNRAAAAHGEALP
jgi:anti-anti-sigma factor